MHESTILILHTYACQWHIFFWDGINGFMMTKYSRSLFFHFSEQMFVMIIIPFSCSVCSLFSKTTPPQCLCLLSSTYYFFFFKVLNFFAGTANMLLYQMNLILLGIFLQELSLLVNMTILLTRSAEEKRFGFVWKKELAVLKWTKSSLGGAMLKTFWFQISAIIKTATNSPVPGIDFSTCFGWERVLLHL